MKMNVPLQRERPGTEVMSGSATLPLGWITAKDDEDRPLHELLRSIREPLYIVENNGRREVSVGDPDTGSDAIPAVGYVPPVEPAALGDRGFCSDYGIRYPYIAGAMANGIASVAIVSAMGKAGMLGFFGAAGLSPDRVGNAIDEIQANLGDRPFGVNLIHAPQEPHWEEQIVDLLIRKGVDLVEASAYLALTPAVVRYRVHGIHEDALGRIVAPNRILAKVSRTEVAARFLSPPPAKILEKLVEEGHITQDQARLASHIPMAQDLTAEADSGGHTDNRPAIALLPTLLALRDRVQKEREYPVPLRIGLAGGISTPASALAAFNMGAAFVLGGSVHQACVESGSSDVVRDMLAKAKQADIAMAPAADMFEMGVKLQVLKRGTMFPMKANRLYEYYKNYNGIHELPAKDRESLEKTIFRASIEQIWDETRRYFQSKDPAQIERADRDPKHKMALIFRWYLGRSSGWANSGDAERTVDFQVWCGPAMGAFNEWTTGTFLEDPKNRRIVTVGQNILYGAAVLQRANSARLQGISIDRIAVEPLTPERLQEYFY